MNNPFLDKSFQIKWSQLQPQLVEPAIREALERAQKRIDIIAAQDKAQLSFDSTLQALEEATEELQVAWGKVGHLDAVCNSGPLRDAYHKMLPEVTAFFAGIPLNARLWAVFQAYSRTEEAGQLTGTRKRLLEETLADFREAGAGLPPEKKERLEAIEQELARLTQKFSENVLDATNAFERIVEDESRLEGLPEMAREQARQSALEKGSDGEKPQWRFTLRAPSFVPAMKYLEDGALRKELWKAYSAVGSEEPYDNTSLVRDILALREEKARLLGKEHFADQVIERRMAGNGATALGFVEDLHRRIRKAFVDECADQENYKAVATGQAREPLEPWEMAYWAERMRRERYDFDEEQLRPYFPIGSVIKGMFGIAEKVFQISIQECPAVCLCSEESGKGEGMPETYPPWAVPEEVWHRDVKFYELYDAGGEKLGAFYADWHPRESKRGGAWMNYLLTGCPPLSGRKREPHLGLICGNLTPSLQGKPALLTHNEVETIFHEFGHLLHHLLGEVAFKSLNGVNVVWDFVELPSQIMQNWCWERESLDLFARHYETGECIPEALLQKMRRARNFHSAVVTMRQLSFAKMDLELHMHLDNFKGKDLEGTLRLLLADYRIPTRTEAPSILWRFTHLFSSSTGYAAAYYSYKWAEVLDADAFTRFQKEGLLSSDVGREFREKILSKGNSEDAGELFEDFMGRGPDLNALLIRAGLASEEE